MSVYIDPLRPCCTNKNWRWPESCHMVADTEEELIEFAVSIGLKPEWIQRTSITHFDLNKSKRVQALKSGAEEIDMFEMAKRVRTCKVMSGRKQK